MSVSGLNNSITTTSIYTQAREPSIYEKRENLLKNLESALTSALQRGEFPVNFTGNNEVETAIEVIPSFAHHLITDENREYYRWSSQEAVEKTLADIAAYRRQ